MLPPTIVLPSTDIPVRPAEFFEDRPAVMVASHPRSGTHFLMNSLASCYGYVSRPWINLGTDSANINYFDPPHIGDYLTALAARPIATLVKSHHPAEFFEGQFERIGQRWLLFVPIRHPVDTLLSYWRHLNGLSWFEGPRTSRADEFFRAEPCGGLLRWQRRQYPNMMVRWADFTESWLDAAESSTCVVILRYEELVSDFAKVMTRCAASLRRSPLSTVPPSRDDSKWIRSEWAPGNPSTDREALRSLCHQTIGRTLDRLGYS